MNPLMDNAMKTTAAAGGLCFLVLFALFAFWLMMLIDILKNEFTNPTNKIIWLVLILAFAPIGTPLYYFIGRNQKKETD